MPFSTKYVLIVSMDVEPEKEALFNEVYDHEHLPNLKKVPGVRAATRCQPGRSRIVARGPGARPT